jgi:hypothetical protein
LLSSSTNRGPAKPRERREPRWHLDKLLVGEAIERTDIANLATVDEPFGLPEMPVASGTSRVSCGKPREARVFTPIRESSGESRLHKPARET